MSHHAVMNFVTSFLVTIYLSNLINCNQSAFLMKLYPVIIEGFEMPKYKHFCMNRSVSSSVTIEMSESESVNMFMKKLFLSEALELIFPNI